MGLQEDRPGDAALAGQLLRPRQFTPGALLRAKAAHPGAPVVAHPECTEAVRDMADMVCSTELMVEWSRQQKADTLIVTTESGMIHRLRREVPNKTFVAAPTDRCACNECKFMKMNTLQKVRDCLKTAPPRLPCPKQSRPRPRSPSAACWSGAVSSA